MYNSRIRLSIKSTNILTIISITLDIYLKYSNLDIKGLVVVEK